MIVGEMFVVERRILLAMKAFLIMAAILVFGSALIQLISPGFFAVSEPSAVRVDVITPADIHLNALNAILCLFELIGICFALVVIIMVMCKKFAASQRQPLSGMSIAVLMTSMSLPQFVNNVLAVIQKFLH